MTNECHCEDKPIHDANCGRVPRPVNPQIGAHQRETERLQGYIARLQWDYRDALESSHVEYKRAAKFLSVARTCLGSGWLNDARAFIQRAEDILVWDCHCAICERERAFHEKRQIAE